MCGFSLLPFDICPLPFGFLLQLCRTLLHLPPPGRVLAAPRARGDLGASPGNRYRLYLFAARQGCGNVRGTGDDP